MQVSIQNRATASMRIVQDVENELDSDLENTNQVLKKIYISSYCSRFGTQFPQAKLNDTLEEIVTKLADKYSPGLCDNHPNLPYFHHHVFKLAF